MAEARSGPPGAQDDEGALATGIDGAAFQVSGTLQDMPRETGAEHGALDSAIGGLRPNPQVR
jgi:hypothetical protein